jgi:hypothetical protein
MTATTTTRSAYPTAVDDLIPHARDLADQLGRLPSRNQLKKTFRVGAPKANALLDALTAPPVTHPDPSPAPAAETTEPPDLPAVTPATDPPAPSAQPRPVADPGTAIHTTADATPAAEAASVPAAAVVVRRPVVWPVLILCLPAFVAIWAGWVEMGRLTGFGKVVLLPGIADRFVLDTAITLPIGVETYAAYALWVWLSGRGSGGARTFAKRSAIASLAIGGLGQIAYHLMTAWHWTAAPWPITAVVACIPVAVLGMGAALAHLTHGQH